MTQFAYPTYFAQKLRDFFFSDVLEALPQSIFVKNANPTVLDNDDEALKYVYLNEWFEIVTGLPRQKLIGHSAKNIFPKDYQQYFAADRATLAGECGQGQSSQIKDLWESLETPKGSLLLHTRKTSLCDDHQIPQFLVGTFQLDDQVHQGIVTERRSQLSQTDSTPPRVPATINPIHGAFFNFRVLEVLPTAVAVKDFEFNYLYVNRRFDRLFGLDDDEAVGKSHLLNSLDSMDREFQCGMLYERSSVVMATSEAKISFHIKQRPICNEKKQLQYLIYTLWPMKPRLS